MICHIEIKKPSLRRPNICVQNKNEFVEKIVVHHAQGFGKNGTQKLEIHYNFIGVLEMPEFSGLPVSRTVDTRQGVAVEYIAAMPDYESRSNLSIAPTLIMFSILMNIQHGRDDRI
ncbi:MAG: DUF4368 domain-containing protein [Firmicutes bacterium]|nr:DUF4368 domain-containing protein [Bacillota bacterium]